MPMTLARRWAGNAFGTNTGNVFVKIEGEDKAFQGSLHHNDPEAGIVVFVITGSFDAGRLAIEGNRSGHQKGASAGHLKATARLQPNGSLRGEWETDTGLAGTLVLFPHDQPDAPAQSGASPDQIHTARHTFGPVVIDRSQLVALADVLQKEFSKSRVIVTWVVGTEQSRYLDDFKQLNFVSGRAEIIKLFVREPDVAGVDKIITIEFGQSVNWAMCQGASESWTLGELEKLKRQIRQFERVYSGKAFGMGINQFMLACTLVFLPSLASLRDRAILFAGVIALAYGVNRLHNDYLPHAAIYLDKKEEGKLVRFLPAIFSWFIGIAATVFAGLLGAYLKGWLGLSQP
jgi:hypothetical protein